MEFARIGSSDLEVSRMALGLGFRGQSSESEAVRLIEHAIAGQAGTVTLRGSPFGSTREGDPPAT